MRIKLLWLALLCGLSGVPAAHGQVLALTLEQTIERARNLSPDAQSARHAFRSAYWNYRYYRANYLPALTLTSDPYLDRAINRITMSDGSVRFVEQNLLSTDLTLSLTQNIPLTGGTLFLETSAQRLDMFSDHSSSWQTSPVTIGYRQSLFGYNSLKWDKRIEPVRYQEARKTYVETLELVAASATQKFFDLATAQSNLEIATTNYAHADTLYTYAKGRYDIGTISENEMLQLEINKLTEEANCMNARIEVENRVKARIQEVQKLKKAKDTYDTALLNQTLDILRKAVEGGEISITDYYVEADNIYRNLEAYMNIERQYQGAVAEIYKNEL